MKTILFVCTGNLCRSPMAEGFFNFLLQRGGIDKVRGRSAGTHAVPGAVATPEACRVCEEGGFDISGHRAQFLTTDLINTAELICVMEMAHKAMVHLLNPRAVQKISLLSTWCTGKARERDIPDPYLKPLKSYHETFRLISEGVMGLYADHFSGLGRREIRIVLPKSGENPGAFTLKRETFLLD